MQWWGSLKYPRSQLHQKTTQINTIAHILSLSTSKLLVLPSVFSPKLDEHCLPLRNHHLCFRLPPRRCRMHYYWKWPQEWRKGPLKHLANAYHCHEARENTCEQVAVVLFEFSSLASRCYGSSMSAQPSHFRKSNNTCRTLIMRVIIIVASLPDFCDEDEHCAFCDCFGVRHRPSWCLWLLDRLCIE